MPGINGHVFASENLKNLFVKLLLPLASPSLISFFTGTGNHTRLPLSDFTG